MKNLENNNYLIKGKRYHCSSVTEAGWREERVSRYSWEIKTLCGLFVVGRAWDFPGDFCVNDISYSGLPKCKKCLFHKDYPLLLLSEA